jgi:MinD-like ATPase involved in chromosome partitioning or flagellar assembly
MIVSFYSYKGGSGRTMAVANCAVALKRIARDKRVLVVDFDVEAPGLHYYFPKSVAAAAQCRGLLGFLKDCEGGTPEPDESYIIEIENGLTLMPSGIPGAGYSPADVSWETIADNSQVVQSLRALLRRRADIALVDARTGTTDPGAVAVFYLADLCVILSTLSAQSIDGTAEVLDRMFLDDDPRIDIGRRVPAMVIASRVDTTNNPLATKRYLPKLEMQLRSYLPGRRLDPRFDMIRESAAFNAGEHVPVKSAPQMDVAVDYVTLARRIAALQSVFEAGERDFFAPTEEYSKVIQEARLCTGPFFDSSEVPQTPNLDEVYQAFRWAADVGGPFHSTEMHDELGGTHRHSNYLLAVLRTLEWVLPDPEGTPGLYVLTSKGGRVAADIHERGREAFDEAMREHPLVPAAIRIYRRHPHDFKVRLRAMLERRAGLSPVTARRRGDALASWVWRLEEGDVRSGRGWR